MVTSIQVSDKLRTRLNSLKKYPRQTYEEIIDDLIENFHPEMKSIVYTLEEMSDPKGLIELAEAMKKLQEGTLKTISLEEVEKELGL